MDDTLLAIYRNGAFFPVVPCNLPEDTEVEVHVRENADRIFTPTLEPDRSKRAEIKQQMLDGESRPSLPDDKPRFIPPSVTDPAERAKIRREVVANMQKNPIPANAPRFTREELHERR